MLNLAASLPSSEIPKENKCSSCWGNKAAYHFIRQDGMFMPLGSEKYVQRPLKDLLKDSCDLPDSSSGENTGLSSEGLCKWAQIRGLERN